MRDKCKFLSPLKCQGTMFSFLHVWNCCKITNRDLDENPFFNKNGHRQSGFVIYFTMLYGVVYNSFVFSIKCTNYQSCLILVN